MRKGRARREARCRRSRGLDADQRSDPRRDHGARGRRKASPQRDRHGDLRARLPRGTGRGRGRGRRPGPASGRHRAAAARGRGHARASCGRGRRAPDLRLRLVPAQHVRGRRLSTPAGDRARERLHGRPRGLPRHDCSRGQVGVARRVAPRADRHPRALRGREARHGRNRLVPAERQGDVAAGRPRASSWRRSSRPARSRSLRVRGRAPRARRSRSASRRTRSSSASTACG